jgi:hypothetical protein
MIIQDEWIAEAEMLAFQATPTGLFPFDTDARPTPEVMPT